MIQHRLDQLNRNGESQIVGDHRFHAEHPLGTALPIHQRAAAVTGLNRDGELDEPHTLNFAKCGNHPLHNAVG